MACCFFLVFRIPRIGGPIQWDKPTGGLVMEAETTLQGIPIADFTLARAVLEQRYHCHPGEQLLVAEVYESREMRMAATLHERWETEQREFLELMAH